MMEEIQNNLKIEMQMVKEIFQFIERYNLTPISEKTAEERRMILLVVQSIQRRIKLLNSSLGEIIRAMSITKKLTQTEKKIGVERVEIKDMNQNVALKTKDKEKYLEELSISDRLLKKLRKKSIDKEDENTEYKQVNTYAKASNRLFLRISGTLLEKGYFKNLNIDLRKGNVLVLTATYISMMLFTTSLSMIAGLFLALFFFFMKLSPVSPFIIANSADVITRLGISFLIFLATPLVTFGAFYFYPQLERKSITRKIESELPFVVIHMGSISGSGVEPTQIFKIVGLNKDYGYTRGEIRKLINQVNVYGYDLITALKNVARLTPSAKLSELFNGLATTISSGGDLKTFFEKRAESLLLNYRLERERFTKIAETFMDIYISVVIATPMILLLLLVMISVSGVNVGFGVGQLTFLIIFAVGLVNIIFLWLLSIKQPAY